MRLGLGPYVWDLGIGAGILGLEAGIYGLKDVTWASRRGYGPQVRDLGLEAGGDAQKEEKEKRRNFPMCENIGHLPLWGLGPKRMDQ